MSLRKILINIFITHTDQNLKNLTFLVLLNKWQGTLLAGIHVYTHSYTFTLITDSNQQNMTGTKHAIIWPFIYLLLKKEKKPCKQWQIIKCPQQLSSKMMSGGKRTCQLPLPTACVLACVTRNPNVNVCKQKCSVCESFQQN